MVLISVTHLMVQRILIQRPAPESGADHRYNDFQRRQWKLPHIR